MVKTNNLSCKSIYLLPLCPLCQLGKSSKLHLSPFHRRSQFPLDLIYSDVWGPSPTPSLLGHRYYVIFVDDHSKYIWFYPLMHKSDVFSIFLQFQALVERYFSRTIKSIQTDWGGEFRSLPQIFNKSGITHCIAAPHTHEQQGAVERRHRHITKIGLSLLAHASVPMLYWHYAFEMAVFLINRMPSKISSGVSHFELVYNKPPSYAFL